MNWSKGKKAIAGAIHLDLTNNQVHYGRALEDYIRPGVRWLDIGCGYQILPAWAMQTCDQSRLVRRASYLIGIDVDERIANHPLLTYRVKALGGSLPLKDETFDIVTANMVVEHVAQPKTFLADIHRVLRPGGRFLFHTPNYLFWLVFLASLTPDVVKKKVVRSLEGREENDIFPTHYKLNTPGSINRLAEEAGFAIEELRVVGSSGAFDSLGPIGWAECFLLKGLAVGFHGKFNSNIIGVLQRKGLSKKVN
jgi:ubiquinone/menaquinone biosynthesis C-methylase UbiE